MKDKDTKHLRIRIDAETLAAVKKRADENLRSTNAEILHAIRHALGSSKLPSKKPKAA